MADPVTVHIRKDALEWALQIVDTGRFASFSDLLDFAMGLYLDTIHRDGVRSIRKINRTDLARRSVRMNPHIVAGLLETGFFTRAEIADYALDFYRDWLSMKERFYRYGERMSGWGRKSWFPTASRKGIFPIRGSASVSNTPSVGNKGIRTSETRAIPIDDAPYRMPSSVEPFPDLTVLRNRQNDQRDES